MKYKIGDKVKIIKKFGNTFWSGEMDNTVGLEGKVVDISFHRDIPRFQVQLFNYHIRWWYLEESLESINNITFKYIHEF